MKYCRTCGKKIEECTCSKNSLLIPFIITLVVAAFIIGIIVYIFVIGPFMGSTPSF